MFSIYSKQAFITLLFSLFLWLPIGAYASWLDNITTIVGGHINDLQSRFTENQIIEGKVIATASFRENDRGQDTLHHGSGDVKIIENSEGRFIQLAENFTSTPGPDYHVYISRDSHIDHEERFDMTNQIELGRLIKGSGASYYRIPDNTGFQSVTIWCKAFNEFIMSTDFEN